MKKRLQAKPFRWAPLRDACVQSRRATRPPTHRGRQGDRTTLPMPHGVPTRAQRIQEVQWQGYRWRGSGACTAACAHAATMGLYNHRRGRQPGDGTAPPRPRRIRTVIQRVPGALCIWAPSGRSAACAAGAHSIAADSSSGRHRQQPVAAARQPDRLPARPYTRTHARTLAAAYSQYAYAQ